jgi:hypothetical protein
MLGPGFCTGASVVAHALGAELKVGDVALMAVGETEPEARLGGKAEDSDGELYLLTKGDGMIRELRSVR